MTFLFDRFIPALPEMLIALMACVILMVGLFLENRFKYISYYLTQLTLILAAGLTGSAFLKLKGQWLLFHNTFVVDKLALLLKLLIYLSAFLTFLYSRQYNSHRSIPSNEFYVLGLLSVVGMMVLVSAHHLLTVFLGLELFSLPIYAMVGLEHNKIRCIEAAMKYFVMGAIASGFLLYGISMIFGASKHLDIAYIAQSIANMPSSQHLLFIFGLVFLMAAIVFKLGAAPFHIWVPDVYDGAPTSVTLFLSSAPKIAAFALIIRLLVEMMPGLQSQWQNMWLVVAFLSIGIGNIVAIVQKNIKRLLAYSSISHMGYMVLGLACATPRGNASALFYLINYVLMTLVAFGILSLISRSGFEANTLEDFSGLSSRNPWLAFLMLIVMFSLAGIPPLVGFMAKIAVLEAMIAVHWVGLAVVAIFFAIIGAYYYIRVVKKMYFEQAVHSVPVVRYSRGVSIAISLNGIAVLLLGVFPGSVLTLSRWVF